MGKKPIRIEWNYKGKPDFSSGTGTYPAVKILGLASAFVIPIFLLIQIWPFMGWNSWQTIIAFILAFDISGGLVSNALNSCKRFYHTSPSSL